MELQHTAHDRGRVKQRGLFRGGRNGRDGDAEASRPERRGDTLLHQDLETLEFRKRGHVCLPDKHPPGSHDRPGNQPNPRDLPLIWDFTSAV